MRRQQFGVVIAALVVAVTTPVVVTLAASPAEAAAYRYWSYWHATGDSWNFSKVGATGYRPPNGTVEGWRFAVSPGTATAPAPRQPASSAFDSICGSTPAEDDKKRVALVVDFGVAGDAPSGDSPPSEGLRGSCVVIRTNANGMDVLIAAGFGIRDDSGMVCALSGYPSRGCGDVVADPPAATPKPSTTTTERGGSGNGAGGSANNGGAGRGSGGGGSTNDPTDARDAGSSAAPNAAGSASAGATSKPSGSAGASPTGSVDPNGIPSAAPLDSSEAVPSLVSGAPVADTDGTSSSPLLAGLALLLIGGIGLAAFLRTRARRST